MCGRYALFRWPQALTALPGFPAEQQPHWNIAPGANVLMVRHEAGQRHAASARWGLTPPWLTDWSRTPAQARAETLAEQPMFREALRQRRCLLPANGFYEWRNLPSGKAAYYIRPADQMLFAFAGVYGTWTDPDGKEFGMCAIITTNSGVESDMTPSRLPVIIDPADEADWLNPDIQDINSLYKIMRPYDPELLTITRVSDAINSPKPNSPDLIASIR